MSHSLSHLYLITFEYCVGKTGPWYQVSTELISQQLLRKEALLKALIELVAEAETASPEAINLKLIIVKRKDAPEGYS